MRNLLLNKGLVIGIVLLFIGVNVVPSIGGNNYKISEVDNKNYERCDILTDGSISGYVYQVNGNPISEATVEVIQQDDSGVWVTTTVSDGSYNVTGLPTGDYKVRAFKHGYAREYFDNVFYTTEATIIHVIAPEEITDIDFNLNLGGSISGHVYNNKTGEPIEGVHMYVVPSSELSDDGFHTTTDSNGRYIVENLALGNYKIGASIKGWVNEWYDNHYNSLHATGIMVVPPDTTTDINFYLVQGGSVSGFVYESDGVTPIQNAFIKVGGWLSTGEPIGSGSRTQSDGSYLVTDIPPWNYKVQASKPGFATEFYNSKNNYVDADTVIIEENTTTFGIDFTLDVGGVITGHVYDEEDRTPISGVKAHAYLTTGEWVELSDATDSNGSYSIWLGTGSYYIELNPCDRPNKWVGEWYNNSYDMANAIPVDVTAPNETSGIDFYLAKTGNISGHVYSADGTPINGASVYAHSTKFPGNGATSREDGRYEIEGLPSDNYLVQVSVSGYNSEYYNNVSNPADATLVTVDAPNETSNIDFILTQGIGVYISRPETGALYLFDKEILSLPINYPLIVGKINVKAVAFGSEKVEFYVDDELKYTDNESPFSWAWNEAAFGRHTIKVVVYEVVDVICDELTVWKFL